MTQMAKNQLKLIPHLRPKQLKNHTLWRRTYPLSPCKGVPPLRRKLQLNVKQGDGSYMACLVNMKLYFHFGLSCTEFQMSGSISGSNFYDVWESHRKCQSPCQSSLRCMPSSKRKPLPSSSAISVARNSY